ncbi:unnamed protein product [Discula destructiva]
MAELNWTPLARDDPLSSIPYDILFAELKRRDDGDTTKPQCGSGTAGAYDMAMHIFALFLILVLSTLACGFPLISSRARSGRLQSQIIFYCQHFGTGVLIATAFVHLLPTAFISLNDPCLPWFFNEGYQPFPGLIAMAAVLLVVAIESYLTTRGAGHSHSHHAVWDDEDAREQAEPSLRGGGDRSLAARRGPRPGDIALGRLEAGEATGLMDAISPAPQRTPVPQTDGNAAGDGDGKFEHRPPVREYSPNDNNITGDGEDEDEDDLELRIDDLSDRLTRAGTHNRANPSPATSHTVPGGSSSTEDQKRLMLQCLLLEAGILFHSVFIGMAISVATGPPFVVFLVAIAFHQTFEGLALGSRIAAVRFPRASPRPWLMVIAYGTTTPIGQAIGLGVHRFYDPQSQTGLLMVGVMNAVSSGLLLFAGLVQLLSEDFLTEKSYKTLKGQTRINAFIAVAAGATLMAVVGAFA